MIYNLIDLGVQMESGIRHLLINVAYLKLLLLMTAWIKREQGKPKTQPCRRPNIAMILIFQMRNTFSSTACIIKAISGPS